MENISEALLKELIESVLEGRSVRQEGTAGLLLEERERNGIQRSYHIRICRPKKTAVRIGRKMTVGKRIVLI